MQQQSFEAAGPPEAESGVEGPFPHRAETRGNRSLDFLAREVVVGSGEILVCTEAAEMRLKVRCGTDRTAGIPVDGRVQDDEAAARPEDPRERPLQITPAGRRKLEAAFPAWNEAQDLLNRRPDDAKDHPILVVR